MDAAAAARPSSPPPSSVAVAILVVPPLSTSLYLSLLSLLSLYSLSSLSTLGRWSLGPFLFSRGGSSPSRWEVPKGGVLRACL